MCKVASPCEITVSLQLLLLQLLLLLLLFKVIHIVEGIAKAHILLSTLLLLLLFITSTSNLSIVNVVVDLRLVCIEYVVVTITLYLSHSVLLLIWQLLLL